MYCTKCGVELRESDRFCSQCGAPSATHRMPGPPLNPLMLDKRNKKIAGVCSGFARHLECDVTVVRVLTLAMALATGVGFLAYLAAWMIMPSDHGQWQPAPAAAPQSA